MSSFSSPPPPNNNTTTTTQNHPVALYTTLSQSQSQSQSNTQGIRIAVVNSDGVGGGGSVGGGSAGGTSAGSTMNTSSSTTSTMTISSQHPSSNDLQHQQHRQQQNVTQTDSQPLILTLEGTSGHVTWENSVINNEGMGRKSSKRCCIYKKPTLWNETSSDESQDDGRGAKPSGVTRKKGSGGASGGNGVDDTQRFLA
jgi:protein phosphatase 1 regulatory subunit 11